MLLWADGFDSYGGDETMMSDGPYAAVGGSGVLSTANPRTGPYCWRGSAAGGLRRVFGDDYTDVGTAYAVYVPALPGDSLSWVLAEFRDNGNFGQVGVGVTSTGQVFAYTPDFHETGPVTATIVATSGVCIVSQSYQHVEIRAVCDAANGAVEVRVNGVTVLNVAGIDTDPQTTGVLAQVQYIVADSGTAGVPATVDMDDLYTWAVTSSGFNNDFIGDKKVYERVTNADTVEDDWSKSTGASAAAILGNVPPDDAEYIFTDTVGDSVRLGIADLPAEVVSIAAVMVTTRAWKDDAGNAKIQFGVVSNGTTEMGAEHALSQAPTYYHDTFDVDPDTGAPWTLAAFNAVETRLERTE